MIVKMIQCLGKKTGEDATNVYQDPEEAKYKQRLMIH